MFIIWLFQKNLWNLSNCITEFSTKRVNNMKTTSLLVSAVISDSHSISSLNLISENYIPRHTDTLQFQSWKDHSQNILNKYSIYIYIIYALAFNKNWLLHSVSWINYNLQMTTIYLVFLKNKNTYTKVRIKLVVKQHNLFLLLLYDGFTMAIWLSLIDFEAS